MADGKGEGCRFPFPVGLRLFPDIGHEHSSRVPLPVNATRQAGHGPFAI
jgi:hypothetical protein